jgi:hypothetical protein
MKTKKITPAKKIAETNTEAFDVFTNPAKAIALANHLGINIDEDGASELTESRYDSDIFEYGDQEYRVLTNDEADDANDESIESYIDDCILPELPEQYRRYFDNEAFKADARNDGRGHNLATYDGHENYKNVNGVTYYIYRTN